MLSFLQILFSIITGALGFYALYTDDYQYNTYLMLFVGLLNLLMAIDQFKKNNKVYAWMCLSIFVILIVLVFQSFLN